jgi:RimJ/RimL family protein N-acetyltransferase/heme-degrading monooxygenase HmoA
MSIAVIYRWRVKPGMEAQFVRGWSRGTAAIHDRCVSFGARLHRARDEGGDLWVSYARWPDEESRKACFRGNDFRDLGFVEMREAVAETLPEIASEIVDDQLAEPRSTGGPPLPVKHLELGDGLALRPLDPNRDASALHACFSDETTAGFMPFEPMKSVEETRRRLLRMSAPGSPQWVIVRDDGPALGRVTLMSRRQGVAELGFQVVPAERGRGLARRATCAVTTYALNELGLVRVYGDLDPENQASKRVFDRAGFTPEGREKDAWVTHVGVSDSLIYAATRGWTPPG